MKRLFHLILGVAAAAACSHQDPSANGQGNAGGAAGSEANTGGSAGQTNGTGGTAQSGGAGAGSDFVQPHWLSETGLYEDDMETLADGVMPYEPEFVLWSDTAQKRRWVKLPEGKPIDTSDMDYWVYPIGTKLFKEFTRDGVRVETRLLQKVDEDNWFMMAFQWNDEQSDAEARPDGWFDASGTEHDIPNHDQCVNCHDKMPDTLLGFSAVQLSHDGDGVTLDKLAADGRLSDPPAEPLVIPGNELERAALGYLHANCGNCHQPRSFVSSMVDMDLWLHTSKMASVDETPTVKSTVNVRTVAAYYSGAGGEGGQGSALHTRVVPGHPEDSVLYLRMETRQAGSAMPPVGTELIDEDGSSLIHDWIESLPATE